MTGPYVALAVHDARAGPVAALTTCDARAGPTTAPETCETRAGPVAALTTCDARAGPTTAPAKMATTFAPSTRVEGASYPALRPRPRPATPEPALSLPQHVLRERPNDRARDLRRQSRAYNRWTSFHARSRPPRRRDFESSPGQFPFTEIHHRNEFPFTEIHHRNDSPLRRTPPRRSPARRSQTGLSS